MKHFHFGLLALVALIASDAFAVRNFADKHYTLEVHDGRSFGPSPAGLLTSGLYVFVYDAGTKTLSTIYSDTARTSKTNPVTRTQFATDGGINFYGPNSSYDIFIAHSDGSIATYSGVTSTMHRLYLDRTGSDKMMVVPFASNTTETDTGVDFPKNSFVRPPLIEVVTAHSAKTIDVGLLSSETNGDADGFIVGASLASTGFVRPWTTTTGSNETYVNLVTLGALIGKGSTGTDAANDFGQLGGYGHIVTGSNATSLTYTCSSGTTTAAGYIYVPFKVLR
jgi:hypothetical protein